MNRHFPFLTSLIILYLIIGCSEKPKVAPILIIAADRDFGTYTAEILKTEGFNEFEMDSLAGGNINSSFLGLFDLVILAESGIEQDEAALIREYVRKGGRLISVMPQPELSGLFGVEPRNEMISGGYVRIDTAKEQGRGLNPALLQFHGLSEIYNLKSGESLAGLFTDKADKRGFPAIVSHNFEQGRATAFLYNLPRSIVYTRQGNPDFAGMEKDGIPGIRGMDLFTEGWVDTSNNTINQADEQIALLSHCIENMLEDIEPLPRFWYFPDSLECLVTLTNDGEYKTEADFEIQFRDIDSMGAKMSIYIIGVDNVSREWVERWTEKGFEIAGHPDDTREAGNPTWNNMDSALRMRKNEIAGKYGLTIRTNVNHWFVWCGTDADGKQDFGAQARLEEKHGIEMDINYAHYDMKSNQGEYFLGTPGKNQGNFTGSGHVMKFAGADGKVINVFQHFNAVYDQQYNESHDPEGFFNCFRGLMDRSLQNGVYSFISVKSHNDEYYFSKTPLLKMLAYANLHNIPVWTELRLLEFLRMKDQASFSGQHWKGNQLKFRLNSAVGDGNGLTFFVPYRHQELACIEIMVNGQPLKFIVRRIKGFQYAMATVKPGENYSVEVQYKK